MRLTERGKLTIAVSVTAVIVGPLGALICQSGPQPVEAKDALGPCPEDAALLWDGEEHGVCRSVDDLIVEEFPRAVELIMQNPDGFDFIADTLIEKEVIK